jgi:peptide/nickel transport system permease protein
MAEVAAPPIALPRDRGATRAARVLGFFITLARRKPLGFAGLIFIIFMVVVALMPGVFALHAPEASSGDRFMRYCFGPKDTFLCPTVRFEDTLLPRGEVVTEGSLSHPLGTDQLGRDIYSRIIHGTRVAVSVGLGAVFLSSLIALLVGVTSGYFGGNYDAVIQRFVDAIMALPVLVILIMLPTLIGQWDMDGPLGFDSPGITHFKLIVILGILGGASGSRIIRSAVLGIRSAQYLEAATVIGGTHTRIMVRHVVPNIFGPLMVQATIALGGIILTESALSYLGFGVTDPRQPSWGQMLQLGANVSSVQPLQAVYPGIAIALAVFSFNMLGDALRDLLDPRLRGARGSFA